MEFFIFWFFLLCKAVGKTVSAAKQTPCFPAFISRSLNNPEQQEVLMEQVLIRWKNNNLQEGKSPPPPGSFIPT